jgi:signal transduction histidine kinase
MSWLRGHLLPLTAALLAAVSAVAAVAFVDQGERDRALRAHRAEVRLEAGEARAKLEQALSSRVQMARGLAAFVVANPNSPTSDRTALDAYARSLLAVERGIRSVSLSEDSVVIYTYPLEGNEASLGTDLLAIPEQRDAVRRALLGRQFILAGPLDLLQGGVGLVARQPIILPFPEPGPVPPPDGVGPSVITESGRSGQPGRVWGLSLVVFHLGSLLGEAGLVDSTSPLEYALRGADGWGAEGEVFYGRPQLFEESPETLDISLPTGSWQLAAAPRAGWSSSTPTLVWIRVSGGIVAVLLALLVYSLVRDPVRLREAVERASASAVENARLYEAERRRAEHAALDERQRLARELHDSVTQTLFSASLIAEVLPRLWQRNPQSALPRLEELRQLTRGALAEMRTLLLELRPAVLLEMPLPDLLRQLAEAVTGRARLPVSLDVEGDRTAPLPPDVQIALYRITQEALNNAAKHAGATAAFISLSWRPEGVQLRVRDNGRGFDPSVVPGGHLGIGVMQERAASAGAAFVLHSAPGEGTHISVDWVEPPSPPVPTTPSASGSANGATQHGHGGQMDDQDGRTPQTRSADSHIP